MELENYLDSISNFYYVKEINPGLYQRLQNADSQSVTKLKSSATYLREALAYFIRGVFKENNIKLPNEKDDNLFDYENILRADPVKGIPVQSFFQVRKTCNAIVHCDEKEYQKDKKYVSHESLTKAFIRFDEILWGYYSAKYPSRCNRDLYPNCKYDKDYAPINSWKILNAISENNMLGFDREVIGCRIQASGNEFALIRQYPTTAYFINNTHNSFAARETGTGKEIREFVNHPVTLSVPSAIETVDPLEEEDNQKKRLIMYALGNVEPFALSAQSEIANLSVSERLLVMIDITKAVRFLHKNNMSHRGLTPNTVFVMKGRQENDIHAVLTSLEHCKLPEAEQTVKVQMKKNKDSFSGYTYYSASMIEKIQSGDDETVTPEEWKKEDIYSLGAVFWYLLYERTPSKRIGWGGNIHSLDEELINKFSGMTQKNPDLRPDINAVYAVLRKYDVRDD